MILNGPGISYTEPDIGAEFVPPLPEHPREAIVKLCEHCTNRLLHRDELLGYEYWSFAEAATDEQAEVLCKMKMRRPYTLPEMIKLTGMPEAQIEKMLDDMSYTGLLEYNWENPERAKQWVLPMLVPGSAEFLNMRVSQLEEHPVYAKFFEQASKGPLSKATPMVPPGGAGIGMHVIPVEKAIDAASTSVPIEHIEHWLDKYEGKYAASTCCRSFSSVPNRRHTFRSAVRAMPPSSRLHLHSSQLSVLPSSAEKPPETGCNRYEADRFSKYSIPN